MKKILFIIVLLANNIVLKANKLDSLLLELNNAKEDTVKVMVLYKIGFEYGIENSDSAIYYYEQGKKISKKTNFQKGIIQYYIDITGLYNDMGKLDTVLLMNIESVVIAEQYGDKKLLANCISNVGNSFLNLKKLDSASAYYYKAENILNNIKDNKGLFILFGNLCAMYANLGQNEKAIQYAMKAVVLNKQGIGSDNDFIYILTNLGATYVNLNKNDSVIYFANKAVALGNKVKNYPIIAINLQNLIYAKTNSNEYAAIMPLANQMAALKSKINTPKFEAKINFNYAIAYYYSGNAKQAETYGLKAFEISKSNKLPSITQSACVILTKIESTLKNYALANKFDALRDSIYDAELNEEVVAGVQDVEKKYETQKKETEIIKLNATNRQKSITNKIFIGSTIGLSLLGLLGFRNFSAKRKLQQAKITELEKDKQLFIADAMLQGQEEERGRIAKDLHDGLGGMLSGVKFNFINMKENLIMDASNVEAFQKSINQLDSTIVELRKVAHNLMPEALIKFGLKNAIEDYCSTMQLATNIKIIYEQLGDERILSNTINLHIYRIIQELVNNAIKHANASQIFIQLTKTIDKVLITIEDNGKGLDKNAITNSKGIGFKSVQQRVDYLNGNLTISSSDSSGTSIHIDLKI